MQLQIRSVADIRIFHIEDAFGFCDVPEIRSEIYSAAALKKRVIVSLERCTDCDPAALEALRTAKTWLGGRLEFVVPANHFVTLLLDLVGWSDEFCAANTLGEALIRCVH